MKEVKIKRQFDQVASALSIIMDQVGDGNLLHSRRVAVIATALSEIVMPEKRDIIFYASLLHDVGAVIFGKHILMFPSLGEQKRDPSVFKHPTIGSEIISKISGLKEAEGYIQDHHEWYDGSGYPLGKKGKEISLGAQVIRIADAIDMKIHVHGSDPFTDIYNYLRLHEGREFDPDLWNAVLDLKNKDAGTFFTRLSDNIGLNIGLQMMYSEVIKSVDPYWLTPTGRRQDYIYGSESALAVFSEIIDAKHKYTRKHSERVAFLGGKIARIMELPQMEIEQIKHAAYLHDIGKVFVPPDILDKVGLLASREIEIMKRYTIITMEILDTIEAFRNLTAIAGFCQERYDGKGYPDGLSGEDIPVGARILGVADAVDAMLSDRAYRKALSVENTIVQLERCSGTQFDPTVATVVAGLLSNKEILEEMRKEHFIV